MNQLLENLTAPVTLHNWSVALLFILVWSGWIKAAKWQGIAGERQKLVDDARNDHDYANGVLSGYEERFDNLLKEVMATQKRAVTFMDPAFGTTPKSND